MTSSSRLSSVKKKILLVHPWIYDFAAYDFWITPLGLLYIAGVLRENGFDVNLIDCLDPYHPDIANEPLVRPPSRKPFGQGKFARERISKPECLNDIPRSYHRYGITPRLFIEDVKKCDQPDLIMVTSMMTYWYPGVFEAIRLLSRVLPETPVLLGGQYATLCRDHAVSHSGATEVIAGEGENILPDLIKKYLNVDIEIVPDPDDLDSYPYPALDLLRCINHIPILTSRGCPFHCTYCASGHLHKGFRRRNPLKVADEISYWFRTAGARDFVLYDDAFLVNPSEMAVPLLEELIRRSLNCRFHCPNGLHLSAVDDRIARLLFKAGFVTIRFGFESSNPATQKMTGGKTSSSDLVRAVRSLKRAGYNDSDIGVYLLCGLPGQQVSEIRDSIEFVKSCGARPILAEFSPIPGTDLWERSCRTCIYPIGDEPLFQNNTLLPCRSSDLTLDAYRAMKKLARNI